MKYLKHVAMVLFIIITSSLLPKLIINQVEESQLNIPLLLFIILVPILMFFNFMVRSLLRYENYFTSKYNIFTGKLRKEITTDIPKELMFEKIIEVINESKFKLLDQKSKKLKLLASSPISMWSWGENLYINIEEKNHETIVKFCSCSVFGIYTWGKNEDNFITLLNEIEESLIV